MEYTDKYDKLASLFVEVIQSQQSVKLKDDSRHLYYAETLAIKLFRHIASMRQIADGLSMIFPSCNFAHVDHSSVMLLTRAACETYLTFFFIFAAPNDTEQQKYRYKTWELAGLIDRQKFYVFSKEGTEIQKEEAIRIEILKNEIQQFDEFLNLSVKEQKMIFGGKWRLRNSWVDLAKIADINEKYFKNIYGFMCSYAHSSFLSVIQISQAKSISKQTELANSMLGIGVVLMSHFLFSYTGLFEEAASVFDENHEVKKIAEIWRFGSDDMSAIYGS